MIIIETEDILAFAALEKFWEITVSGDLIEFRILTPRAPPSSFTLHPSGKFTQLCALYIKRLLLAALNSSLNGFSPGEEIFSKNLEEERGHYCFNPLTSSHFKTFLEGEMASCLPNPNLNPLGPRSCWRLQPSLHLSISRIPSKHGAMQEGNQIKSRH